MLPIRREQMQALQQASRDAFVDEMIPHSQDFSPRLCAVIGEEQLRVALRRMMDRAAGYGFSNRGPLRLFLESMFLFGSAFDTDPQYPWAAKALHGSDHQMQRAERLYEEVRAYQAHVSGPEAANTRQALRRLAGLGRQPLPFPATDFVAGMRREMTRVFPQKAVYVGEEGLTALIAEGAAEARRYFLDARGAALLVALMFAFGHGCTDDPLYPWIARTLNDDRITDPAARAARLEKKAVTWLEHVLAAFPSGAHA